MSNYRDLQVWKEGKALSVAVYKLTQKVAFSKDFGLTDQIRRSSVSVPSNIAEGDARRSDKDSVRFFLIAQGSLAELSTQLEIASEIGYLPVSNFTKLNDQIEQLQRSLGALIRTRREIQ